MDDGQTKDTLDALADLFLTGAGPARPKRVPPSKDSDEENPSSAINTSSQHTTQATTNTPVPGNSSRAL